MDNQDTTTWNVYITNVYTSTSMSATFRLSHRRPPSQEYVLIANDLVCVLMNHPDIHTSIIHSSLNFIIKTCTYCTACGEQCDVEINYYRQSAANKSDFIQTLQCTDKASAGFLEFHQHLAHEDDDFLAKERTNFIL